VVAGWAFVVGKVASCATIALAFGRYVWPQGERILAVAAVLAFTAVNYRGVGKTVAVTRFLVGGVLIALATAVVGALAGGTADPARLTPFWPATGVTGVLQAAALLFYAFAGYARIATLGEEVVEPARTIPRAIPMALLIALVVYAAVALAVLLAIGPEAVSAAEAPVAEAVEGGDLSMLGPVVRVGAVLATLGVLLSLLAGVARTTFAMAADGELPRALSAVHPRFRVPHRAELAIGIVVASLAAVAPLTEALALSSFTVLLYYAITNAAALTLRPEQRRWPPAVAVFGLLGCGVLAFSLPARTLALGGGLLVVVAAGHGLRSAAARRRSL
jgi:APA family basic amino acid/polyamine antiporter